MHKLGPVSTVKNGQITAMNLSGEPIALYRLEGEILATTDICTHADCLLSENGAIYDDTVECSCHGSTFDIRSGLNLNPPSSDPLRTFRVVIEGDDLLVESP